MYKQFCKNLNNYLNSISEVDNSKSLRLQIAKDLLPLADIDSFNIYKTLNDPHYYEICGFISELSKCTNIYPSLEKFIWELWAYGFDITPNALQNNDTEFDFLREKAKTIDLLLSTHYFAGKQH